MFDFNDAQVDTGFTFKYIQPGIEEVEVTKVSAGKNTAGNPYLDVEVKNEQGSTCNNRYSLNQVKREGAKTTAFEISKNQIFQLLVAVGVSENDIKSKLSTATDEEALATVISSLAVGKKLRMKFNGEERVGTEGRSNWILTKFGTGYFAEPISQNPSKLKFSADRNIKMLPNTAKATAEKTTVTEDWEG